MKLTSKARFRLSVALTVMTTVTAALTLFVAVARAADRPSVPALLEQFEEHPSARTANSFMQALAHEQFIESPVTFSSRTPLDSMRQQVYYWGAEWLYDKQQYERARCAALKALPLFHPQNGSRADCLNLLGITCLRLADFSNAAHYAKQCLEIDMRSGDDDLISSSMNTVAGVYMAANQPRDAEKYILGALSHAKRVDNPQRQAVILGMASEIYHKLGDDARALPYAEEAYAIDSLLNREPQTTIRLTQKGSALLGLRRYAEAEQVYARVLPRLRGTPDRHSYAIALNNMGTALLNLGRPRQAIYFYNEASGIFAALGDLYNETYSHRGLYESYWEINPDSAKRELNRFNELKDSLYSHSTAEALSRYNAEFGNDLLQRENSEMRLRHQRTLLIGILLLLLVLLASWLIISFTRRRQQQRMRKLLAEIERLRSGADPRRLLPPPPAAMRGRGHCACGVSRRFPPGITGYFCGL